MSIFFDTLAPEHIRKLPIYRPGKPVEELERELGITDALKLASNENPAGPSPRAVDAAIEAVRHANVYPDGGAFKLRAALSSRLDVSPDELIFGAGSNEIIHMLIHALCGPDDEVLTHRYAFISYRLAALSFGVRFVEAAVTDELGCDVDALIAAMSPRTKIVFVANPNNPTGSYVETPALERIIAALPERALLVVDEAYHEYAVWAHERGDIDYPRSRSYRTSEMPRIMTLRTFSKIYGLSGMRVGYGIGDPRVIEMVNRCRRPFNLNSVAQAAAVAALDDPDHVQRSREVARGCVAAITEAASRVGARAYPSMSNFVLVDVGRDAGPVYEQLLKRGVIVRPMGAWGLPRCIRVSVCLPAHIDRMTSALTHVLGS